MKVPFEYGELVSKQQFVNRENDRKRLQSNLTSGINTILISPRRWGKSSLVKQVEIDIKEPKYVFCYIDLFRISDEEEFYKELATCVISKTSNQLEEVLQNIKSFIKRITPKLSIGTDPLNEIELNFDYQELENNYSEILDLPQKIAKSKNIHIIVCIDEFQNLSHFKNPLLFQQRLRSVWQHHKNVSYCLYGSQKHMMSNIFNSPSMPFYRFGDVLFLEKISTDHWKKYIVCQFKKTGKKISIALAQKISDQVKNHSYYVQQYAHLVWVRTDLEADETILQDAKKDLLRQNNMHYTREVENLSKTQINFLKALASGKGNLHSKQVIDEFKLGTSGNVSKIKSALEKKEVIDIDNNTVEFNDPVFQLWFQEVFLRKR